MILNFLQSIYLKSSCLFVHFPFSTIESSWQRGLLIFTIHHTEFITVPNSSDLFHKWLLNNELIRSTRSVSISPWEDMGFLNYFNWRITTLQYCDGFCHISTWVGHRYLWSLHPEPLPPFPIPLGCPRALPLGTLLHASNLHWSSILHMVMCMFQCYSFIIPHLPDPAESKSLFFTSVSSLLPCM